MCFFVSFQIKKMEKVVTNHKYKMKKKKLEMEKLFTLKNIKKKQIFQKKGGKRKKRIRRTICCA